MKDIEINAIALKIVAGLIGIAALIGIAKAIEPTIPPEVPSYEPPPYETPPPPITYLYNVGDCIMLGTGIRKIVRIVPTLFPYPDNAIYYYSNWTGSGFSGTEDGDMGGSYASTNTYKVPSCILPCIPSWYCEQPLNGYQNDGCSNRRLNSLCNPSAPPIEGISTTDPAQANADILAYYQARVPSCNRWGYIHVTIGVKVIEWGVSRWGWDAGAVENMLRSHISDNPCYMPPPPPPSSLYWVKSSDGDPTGWAVSCNPNRKLFWGGTGEMPIQDPNGYSFVC